MHHVLKDVKRIIGQKYFELMHGPARYQRGQSNGLFKVIILLVILLSPCHVVPLAVTPANDEEEARGEAEEPPAVAPASNPEDVTDEDRLSWIEGMEQSSSWVHERVLAKMLGYDSSTEEEGWANSRCSSKKLSVVVLVGQAEAGSPHLHLAMV